MAIEPIPIPDDYGAEVAERNDDHERVRELRRSGASPERIAKMLDLPLKTVRLHLTNRVAMEAAALTGEQIGEILQLELDRLDDYLQGHYYAAAQGDPASTKAVLQISKERREWLKWAKPEPTGDMGITNNILVIGGDEASYLAGLEQVRLQLESEHRPASGE